MIIYSTSSCPRCAELKAALTRLGIPHQSANLEDPETIVYLRCDLECYEVEAPIIEANGRIIPARELFVGGKLDEKKLKELTT